MSEDRLREELRGLPEVRASDRFAEGVFGRIESHRRRARAVRRSLAVAALGLLVVGGGGAEALRRQRREAREVEAMRLELESLRTEQRALAREVSRLSRDKRRVYLGGDDQLDVVMDLGSLPAAAPRDRPRPKDLDL